jgi:tetratricopeptide (TPR) repeat protein
MDLQTAMRKAVGHHRSGKLWQARNLYEKILKKQPDNPDVLHLLGVLFSQCGDYGSAVRYISKALHFKPSDVELHYNLGNALQKKGDLDGAINSFQAALRLNPDLADVHYNLGTAFLGKGQLDEAIDSFQKALRLKSNLFDAYYNLGNAYRDKGQLDEAISSYQKAIQLNPNFAAGYCNMGNVLQQKGLPEEAISAYRHSIRLDPDFVEAHYNMGNVLREKGQLDEAISCYQKAIQIKPDYADAHINLGIALKDKGQVDEAVRCYEKALRISPDNGNAYFNLGLAVEDQGRLDEAISYYRRAVQTAADLVDAHWNLSLALLLTGNFEEGWEEYEWRWKRKENTSRCYNFPKPFWDGSSLNGKTVFVYSEQGIGDEIMFASCLPDVITQAALCIVACEKRLVPLFSRSFPACMVIEHFDPGDIYPSSLPSVDVKIAIGSLPKFLRPDPRTFSEQKAYLIPHAGKLKMWHDRFTLLGNGLKVGISWRGGSTSDEKLTRSILLAQWAQLFSLQRIQYVNLQYGDCDEELRVAKESIGVTIHDWEDADPLKDLDNFASQVAALDLVISIDNATVHMAGALGIPVWTLLPFVPNWRWMLDREGSPWYPAMRLFRQPSPGEWQPVMDRVKDELLKLTDGN